MSLRRRARGDRSASLLEQAVSRVVDNDNCTGCGVCPLISPRITAGLNSEGFLRPVVAGVDTSERDADEALRFSRICPGVTLRAPDVSGRRRHPTFGSYVKAWEGWAVDADFRHAGSSGGVLTALGAWLISAGHAEAVIGSAMSIANPTRTVPIRITSRVEALAAAGSRYAPVANTLSLSGEADAFIGKPCEVSARCQLAAHMPGSGALPPVLLSFFCAGTPSQHATDELARGLGVEPADVASLRYRGNGWPGRFEIRATDGRVRSVSYEESWGTVLGRKLQNRCKLCPDATGEHADVAVGDYWATDDRGFPTFDDAAGKSVVIARTERGAALLSEAIADKVIHLEPLDLDDAAAVQPLQTERRRTLAGRLVGRKLAGRRIPRYRSYGLLRGSLRHGPENLRAAAGMFARSTGLRK